MRCSFLAVLLIAAVAVLTGCGIEFYPKSTPLFDKMSGIVPGVSTKDETRRLLGEPFYSSTAWDAELYAGAVVVHLPTTIRIKPATLLVVYGPGDLVSGITYQGDGCIGDCRKGDTKGLDIEELQVLLAPPAETERLIGERGAVENCTILVDATNRFINGYSGYGLYLDERFLQHVDGEGFFRIEVPPQKHLLSCLSVWQQIPQGELPEPGHALVRDYRIKSNYIYNLNEELTFECSAGDILYFRLKHGLTLAQIVGCNIELIDEVSFLALVQNSRLVIVPDSP